MSALVWMMSIQMIFLPILRMDMNQDDKGPPQHGGQTSKEQQGQQPGQKKPGQQQDQLPSEKSGQKS
jgi:hypothetical protein